MPEDTHERARQISDAVKNADDERKRIDDERTETLNKVLEKLDDCISRMDTMSSRMDAFEKVRDDDAKKRKADASKKRKADETVRSVMSSDDDDDDDTEAKGFAEQPNDPTLAKQTVADSRADEQKLAHALADAQERADRVCAAWGLRAPPALAGEGVLAYRKRLLRQHQRHSEFANVNLDDLNGPAFDIVEQRILADSQAKSSRPDVAPNQLRMITKKTPSGHVVNEFFGSPSAWMNQFSSTRRYVTKINTKFND
jgi:hypothetical protein